MNQKLVLFIVNSTSGGGAEVSAMTIVEQLRSDGYNVLVIALNLNQFPHKKKPEHVIQLGRTWKSGICDTYSTFKEFRSTLEKLNPALVVAHCELPELYCALAPNLRNKLIVVEHTSNPWNGRKTIGRITRFLLRLKKSSWVTVDKSQNKIWCGSRKPKHIYNPVIKNKLKNQRKFIESIAFIGRLNDDKRPHLAIEAAINNSMPIAVIGDGYCKEELVNRFSENREIVTFYGFLENPWAHLSEDTLIVMPSKYEGDGLVAVEAIINEFPIVLADNEDLRRFELPSVNYFRTERELSEVLQQVKNQGVDRFKLPNSIIEKMQHERDIRTITSNWIRELGLDE